MRLILPSASVAAVFAASLPLIDKVKRVNSVDASTVDTNHDNKHDRPDGHNNFLEECTFFHQEQEQQSIAPADVGILCSDPHRVCAADSTSSLGGRCIAAPERELQAACVKCVGELACANLTQAFIDVQIGCGSCVGERACMGVIGESPLRCANIICEIVCIG